MQIPHAKRGGFVLYETRFRKIEGHIVLFAFQGKHPASVAGFTHKIPPYPQV